MNPTTISDIDADHLAAVALGILTANLNGYGNVISKAHHKALASMLSHFAAYVTGAASGRTAFALPTGMGKTEAVVAFIVALDRCGYVVPVSVAASQVAALCTLKSKLMDHGVAPERIGLKHSLRDAPMASTGDTEHLYQLVTHARVRGGSDFALFGEYRAQPRALCLYDETLWRADTASLRSEDALGAVGWAEHRSLPSDLVSFLLRCRDAIQAALRAADGCPHGVPLELPFVEEGEMQSWTEVIERSGAADKGVACDLLQLLKLSGECLQVVKTGQAAGIVSIRQAIPEALWDVAILDASAPIRKLAMLDRTISVADGISSAGLKSFEDVDVYQYLSGGGRSTLAPKPSTMFKETSLLSKEVIDIIHREQAADPQRRFLVFTYMRRGADDPQARIKADLKAAGIDIEGSSAGDQGTLRRRFEFLTWGQHEGLNGFERCNTVILAGVMQRDHLGIAAAVKGQQGDPSAATPDGVVREMVEAEAAHAVYQAASRGSCRRVIDGKARAMHLHIVHRHQGLKTLLDEVMPGARWHYPTPTYLPVATATGKEEAMLHRLLVALKGIPSEVQQISSRRLKEFMGLSKDETTTKTFSRAVAKLDVTLHGWMTEGRSFMRMAT